MFHRHYAEVEFHLMSYNFALLVGYYQTRGGEEMTSLMISRRVEIYNEKLEELSSDTS